MVSRGLSLLLALAVAFAPAALEVCQAACASAAHTDMAHAAMSEPPAAHSCHERAVTDGPLMSAATHSCHHHHEGQPPAPTVAGSQNSTGAVPPAFVDSHRAVPSEVRAASLSTIPTAIARPLSIPSAVPLRM